MILKSETSKIIENPIHYFKKYIRTAFRNFTPYLYYAQPPEKHNPCSFLLATYFQENNN